MAITAKAARYITIDNKGFEIGALEFGELRLIGCDVPEELAQEGDLEKIRHHLRLLGKTPDEADREARFAKDFYGFGADCLWISFLHDHLWWTFAEPQVVWMINDFKFTGERVRRSIGGWRNTDVNGLPLRAESLSPKLIGLGERPGTEPDAETFAELLRTINGSSAALKKLAVTVRGGTESPARTTSVSFQVPSKLFTVEEVIKTPSAAPDEAGLYAWWFDELPGDPFTGTLEQNGFRLAYIGIASSRPGIRRTLRQRLRNHCKGPIATSTLRRSLAAILRDELNLHPCRSGTKIKLADGEEARLSEWLGIHGRVAWLSDPTPWSYEAELLQCGPPLPLNIRGNDHEFVRKLLALRQQLSSLSHARLR